MTNKELIEKNKVLKDIIADMKTKLSSVATQGEVKEKAISMFRIGEKYRTVILGFDPITGYAKIVEEKDFDNIFVAEDYLNTYIGEEFMMKMMRS